MKKFFKQLFCRHDYKVVFDINHDIIDSKNQIVGTVFLKLGTCSKCGKDELTIHDRIDSNGDKLY